MAPGYTRIYAPVLRSPLLFHQSTVHSAPPYYPTLRGSVPSTPTLNPPRPSPYTLQPQYKVQTPLPVYTHSNPYYSASPLPTISPQIPFSYSVPDFTYASTVSSKGLALILIATLILVALDLVIVRPQKQTSKLETLSSGSKVLNVAH